MQIECYSFECRSDSYLITGGDSYEYVVFIGYFKCLLYQAQSDTISGSSKIGELGIIPRMIKNSCVIKGRPSIR